MLLPTLVNYHESNQNVIKIRFEVFRQIYEKKLKNIHIEFEIVLTQA